MAANQSKANRLVAVEGAGRSVFQRLSGGLRKAEGLATLRRRRGAEEGMSSKPLLRLRGISKSFAGVHALTDVSVDIGAGEIVCFAGENGSGKSTLVKVLAGVVAPDARNHRGRRADAAELAAGRRYAGRHPGDLSRLLAVPEPDRRGKHLLQLRALAEAAAGALARRAADGRNKRSKRSASP